MTTDREIRLEEEEEAREAKLHAAAQARRAAIEKGNAETRAAMKSLTMASNYTTQKEAVVSNDPKIALENGQQQGAPPMTEVEKKPTKLEVITNEELDEEEREFNALRRDLPGVKGASSVGIVNIGVAKLPTKNEFFRTHADFRPVYALVDIEVGMERTFFAVTDDMVISLASIGITVSDHTLYLTITSRGALRIIPVRCPNLDGDQNEYHRSKELGLREGIDRWVRLFTDLENRCYKVFPAPEGRFAEPQWPELKPAKIFRLGFRARGNLIDSTNHPAFLKWAARDDDNKKSK